MKTYTAKQISEILQSVDPTINLRTVRYYTQIGLIPPLELVGNKRVYTDKHLHHLKAVLTLSRTGATLAEIQKKLQSLSLDSIIKIGEQIEFHQPDNVLKNQTYKVNDDVYITISPKISAELRKEVIESVSNILKGVENK